MSERVVLERVQTTTLDNGLRVLVVERHAAPVATFWLWYAVGSRNEQPGRTGISHWVEHMLFKGTPTRPYAALTRAIDRLGGRWNAFTWKDYTAYHEVLPAEHLPVVIEMEADRMRNTCFEPEEVERERTVILSEREGAENFPLFSLQEEVDALAFKVHPYRLPVIGWKGDLRRLTRDDLYAHYRTYYHPGNALAVAVGAFDAEAVLEQVRRAFDPLAPGPPPPPVTVEEPPQEGERRVVLQRPGGATSYVQVAYHAPAAGDPDLPALLVLDGVLGGFDAVRGAVAPARSSRLYRALVDRGLATEVVSSVAASFDPGLLRIVATVRSGVPVATVEAAILEEVERLVTTEVLPEELARVRRQARAQFSYVRDGVHAFAGALGAYALLLYPEAFFDVMAHVERVTPADVQRVAARIFDPRRRTVGWYVPEEGAAAVRRVAARVEA